MKEDVRTSEGDEPVEEMEKLLIHGKEMEDHNKFHMELPAGHKCVF